MLSSNSNCLTMESSKKKEAICSAMSQDSSPRPNESSNDEETTSLGDESNLKFLSKISHSRKDSSLPKHEGTSFPLFPKDISISSVDEDSITALDFSTLSVSSNAKHGNSKKSVVVGIKLKLESWPGVVITRPELDPHSKELMDYALEKLVQPGDMVVGIFVYEPTMKLPEGRTVQDLPRFMVNAIAAWEALGESRQIRVETRLKVSDNAMHAFVKEAQTFTPYTVLLSCSMAKHLKKQVFGTHDWADFCIRHMPQDCTIIVVRHGCITTSARGEAMPEEQDASKDRQGNRRADMSFSSIEHATNFFGNTQLARQTAADNTSFLGKFPGGVMGTVRRYRNVGLVKEKDMTDCYKGLAACTNHKHPNLIGIWSFSLDRKFLVLVTDYYPLGCVYDNLHGMTSSHRIPWGKRISIVAGVASALTSLHGLTPSIVHGCLQSASVVLDPEMEPVLNDYWTIHLRGHGHQSPPFELPIGSFGRRGYLAPELELSDLNLPRSTLEGDVYAFGMLIFEVVTGKEVYDPNRKPSHLFSWVKKLASKKEYREIVDPRLFSNYDLTQAGMLLEIAITCCHSVPENRPAMEEVSRRTAALLK